MFLLVPAYTGSPGLKAVKRLCVCVCVYGHSSSQRNEARKLAGERDDARNNARCTQARKTTHGLDGQHQDVDRTLRGGVSQNDRGQ